ncbi:MAG TPA: hypothetical protein VNZ49_09220 [Bacteroidia bacterium]|jgi:hypothetical protein|nr:hypothetical protein [Bacteroidia bacterium]
MIVLHPYFIILYAVINDMTASDQLFKLIQSLDKQEKRYFKLFASTHRDSSSYVLLFDFINKQKEHNEKEIKKHFKNEALSRQLPVTKNLLHKLILKSMCLYRAGHSMDSVLREMLSSIDFLFEKTFYNECWKTIQKAKKIAVEYEKFPILLEILKWEKRLQANVYRRGLTSAYIKEVYLLESEILLKIENLNEYLYLNKQISFEATKTVHVRSNKESGRIKKLMNSPLLKNENRALSFEAKAYFFQTLSIYSRLTGNSQKSYEYRKLLNTHWEAHPQFIEESPIGYIPVLQNLVNIQVDLKKYRELSETIEKFRNVKVRTGTVKQLIFLSYYPVKIVYHNNTLQQKDSYFIPEAEEEFAGFEEKLDLSHNLMFYYLFSWNYFLQEDYKKSLMYINRILNHPRSDVRIDLHCFARIFNIMTHYELGNMDLLEHLCKSARRFLIKNNRLNEFEEAMLVFFRKLAVCYNETIKAKNLFKDLKNKLESIQKKEFESSLFGYFNFFAWTESKIENRSMADLIRVESKSYF